MLAKLVAVLGPGKADERAAVLLREFGSLRSIFSAPRAALDSVLGDTFVSSLIEAARAAFDESLREDILRARFDLRDQRIVRYILAKLASEDVETLHVTFLDARSRYIHDEVFFRGTPSSIEGSFVPILRKALHLQAAAIVMAHNHPSGEGRPSSQDIAVTRRATLACQALGISLSDHLIVADNAIYSMAAGKHLA